MATAQIYSGVENGSQEHSNFLQRSVQWDAEIIIICSVLLVIFASPIAAFMGIENPTILRISGIIGVLYDGGRLLWSMLSNPIDIRLAKLSLYGNVLWAVVSIPVLALEVLPLSNGGWWVMAGLADFAILFAVLQWYGLRKLSD